MSRLSFAPLQMEQVEDVKTIINEAFYADCFFKKPEYYDRETTQQIQDVVSLGESGDTIFLVGTNTDRQVICAIRIEFKLKLKTDDGLFSFSPVDLLQKSSTFQDILTSLESSSSPNIDLNVYGYISEVSVDTKHTGQGYGKELIANTELYVQKRSNVYLHLLQKFISNMNINVLSFIEMDVLDIRSELSPWYQKQGYQVVSLNEPFGYRFICLDEIADTITTSKHLKILK